MAQRAFARPRSAGSRLNTSYRGTTGTVLCLALLAFLLVFPLLSHNAYYLRLITTMGLYAVLAMGLNVLVGLAGLLDMGYVGFFAVGAYARALLASPQLGIHLSFPVTWVVAVLAAVLLSLAIGLPTLRLRGDYLAIVTMGFAEIIRILLLNLDRPRNITNGPNGIIQVDPITIGPVAFSSPAANYYLILGFAAASYAAYLLLDRSVTGITWRALKDDAVGAESSGINVAFYRMLAFAIGAGYAATAGVLFASWQGAVFPQNFTLNELITVYCMVILGGAGNPAGALLGVGLLVTVPELLRGYSVYRMLIYGVVLVALMIFRPQGLLPSRRRVLRSRPKARKSPIRPEASDLKPSSVSVDSGPVLSVRNVSKTSGGLVALEGVSLDLNGGEVLSIIGPNGAGKTTLVNIISGVTAPASGQCFLEGRPVTGLKPHSIYRMGLSRTFQNLRLFSSMTVAENLLAGIQRRDPLLRDALVQEALAFAGPEIAARQDQEAGSLSYAHRKGLEIARAVANTPDVVLLDEPAAGMSPTETERLADKIGLLKAAGRSVVVVEHQMPLVMAVSDRVIVLDRGRKIAEGAPAEIAANPDVAGVYLGRAKSGGPGLPPSGPYAVPRSSRMARSRLPSPGVPAEAGVPTVPLLELVQVEASYGAVKALHGVSLKVMEGEVVCLLGSNGAGKTTTLRTAMGGLTPVSGKVLFQGEDVTGSGPLRSVAKGMAIVLEGRRVFAGMTVEENLQMGASPHPDRRSVEETAEYVYSVFPRLSERKRQKASTLSGGEQQMLAIGRALMAKPRLLLVEQNARRALEIGQRAYVLQNGMVAAEGPARDLLESPGLYEAYLAGNRAFRQS
jgi:ABC-type branched-subunit amino acid transport system ATPase component/ABC-type branched-subunit amino acid transport system permease subunit